MVFGNGVKKIQAAAYNGARTVFFFHTTNSCLFKDISSMRYGCLANVVYDGCTVAAVPVGYQSTLLL